MYIPIFSEVNRAQNLHLISVHVRIEDGEDVTFDIHNMEIELKMPKLDGEL